MNISSNLRSLSASEKEMLEGNGCTCLDWGRIRVTTDFDPSSISNSGFSGDIILGCMKGSRTLGSGFVLKEGISNASLHNCIIGNRSAIHNIRGYIANYIIGDGVTITDCGRIFTEGESSFGNGLEVAVLNESGARGVRMWDRLSSQLGYVTALYRHRSETIAAINDMTDRYCDSVKSLMGYIGDDSLVTGCSLIRNVRLGPCSVVEDSTRLDEGSVNSSREDPVYIGAGVIMEGFIVCSGTRITGAAVIRNCFIGQGCRLGRQFSAGNSLFFANCEGYHGEACSVFAGPFTVTHHKSTLLIAGMYSFMNAGSGSNQSNHLYKLGPIHQGIMERGSKTTSDSYLLWPARVGPFTLVMGRHYGNPDTSSLPFSYLVEHNNESLLVPAINLRSVGTIRDARKWPGRENRRDTILIDRVSLDMLSPYTVRKMIEGRELLRHIRDDAGENTEYCMWGNMRINRHAIDRGIELYETGIIKYLGTILVKRLEGHNPDSQTELLKILKPREDTGKGDWIDAGGMVAPSILVERLLDTIDSGETDSLDKINESFEAIYDSCTEREWEWVAARLEEEEGKYIAEFTASDILRIVEKWKKAVVSLDYKLYEDAMKEFTLSAKTGFGIDGDEEVKRLDFATVRGSFEENPFVASILDHIREKREQGDDLTARMKKLAGLD
jgi:NDP-sugar pyrophosphorylase family protein